MICSTKSWKHKGSIVDASFVNVPKCHATKKDKKDDESFFGFKDHVKCDSDSKIITDFSVTDASVHDSQEFVGLIDEKDYEVKADSGYVGEKFREEILAKYPNIKLHICAKVFCNTPISDEDKEKNKAIAHSHARIEHIFGYMTRFMGEITSRVHGLERVKRDLNIKNMAYNLRRYLCTMIKMILSSKPIFEPKKSKIVTSQKTRACFITLDGEKVSFRRLPLLNQEQVF